jgi:hypothetical protein
MSAAAILVIWTVVGSAGTQYSVHREKDWRPIGEFQTVASCEEAARVLVIKPEHFRCLKK